MKTEKQKNQAIIEARKKSSSTIELRSFASNIELREAGEGQDSGRVIFGYAAIYSERSTGLPWFEEIIMPGAFDATDFSDCAALFNHDENIILGSVRGGSLEIKVDARGLAYEVTPPDNQYITDMVLGPMSRGDLSKSSFRFQMNEDDREAEEWIWDSVNDIAVRKIHKIARVLDVSPVLFPAYDASESAVRKAGEVAGTKDKAEQVQEEAGNQIGSFERFFL